MKKKITSDRPNCTSRSTTLTSRPWRTGPREVVKTSIAPSIWFRVPLLAVY